MLPFACGQRKEGVNAEYTRTLIIGWRSSLGLAGLAALFLVLGVLAYRQEAVLEHPLVSGVLLAKPREITGFELVGDDGRPLEHKDLLDHWTVLFTGYTYCPDVCPTVLGQLKTATAKLGDRAEKLWVLFLSVDPARDTPEHLAQYVRYFDPRFRAATASEEKLEALGTQMGFVFIKHSGEGGDNYAIDHSASLILLDPEGRLAGYLTPPHVVDKLVADLGTVLASKPAP